MRKPRNIRPDLDDCLLECRLSPVVTNLGFIVLSTGGYLMLIPFPGAYVSTAVAKSLGNGSLGPSTAPGVSGTPVSTSFFMTGTGGISSVLPGNITGVPNLGVAGASISTGSVSLSIFVGSGADEAIATSVAVVTRNTVANDALNPLPAIGGRSSAPSSPVLPAGQSYRSPSPKPPFGVGLPNGPSNPGPSMGPGTPYSPTVVAPGIPFRPMGVSTASPVGSASGTPSVSVMGSPPAVVSPVIPIGPPGP